MVHIVTSLCLTCQVFLLPQQWVVLAGSRNLELPEFYCSKLVEAFSRNGFFFFIGCARGVDRSFRKALASSPWKEHTMVACTPQK
jgi:hypothetical protein